MTISGNNKIVIKDVLVGEVRICSGQSNMEFQMYRLPDFEAQKEQANEPMIRQFLVVQDLSGTPKEGLKAVNELFIIKKISQHLLLELIIGK